MWAWRDHPPQEVPHADCSCGLYAYHSPHLLDQRFDKVVGAVVAWGDIEVHELGFRAQHARAIVLEAPPSATARNRCDLAELADIYGAQLVDPPYLQAAAGEHGSTTPRDLFPLAPFAPLANDACDESSRRATPDSPRAADDRSALAHAGVRLALALVRRRDPGCEGLHYIAHAAMLGLHRAADGWAPQLGVPFAQFAAWWIDFALDHGESGSLPGPEARLCWGDLAAILGEREPQPHELPRWPGKAAGTLVEHEPPLSPEEAELILTGLAGAWPATEEVLAAFWPAASTLSRDAHNSLAGSLFNAGCRNERFLSRLLFTPPVNDRRMAARALLDEAAGSIFVRGRCLEILADDATLQERLAYLRHPGAWSDPDNVIVATLDDDALRELAVDPRCQNQVRTACLATLGAEGRAKSIPLWLASPNRRQVWEVIGGRFADSPIKDSIDAPMRRLMLAQPDLPADLAEVCLPAETIVAAGGVADRLWREGALQPLHAHRCLKALEPRSEELACAYIESHPTDPPTSRAVSVRLAAALALLGAEHPMAGPRINRLAYDPRAPAHLVISCLRLLAGRGREPARGLLECDNLDPDVERECRKITSGGWRLWPLEADWILEASSGQREPL